jgi:hypothetical protein
VRLWRIVRHNEETGLHSIDRDRDPENDQIESSSQRRTSLVEPCTYICTTYVPVA